MPKRKKQQIKRPFATKYFRLVDDKESLVVTQGAASTDEGAIRAAVVKVVVGKFAKALIIDRYTGFPLYNIRLGAGGVQVRYGSGLDLSKLVARRAA